MAAPEGFKNLALVFLALFVTLSPLPKYGKYSRWTGGVALAVEQVVHVVQQ